MLKLFSLDLKNIPVYGFLLKFLEENGMDYGVHVTVIAAFFLYLVYAASSDVFFTAISFFFLFSPIWFPLFALDIFHFRWMDYVGKKYSLNSGRTVFRIKLPQEVTKSPEAMEFVLNAIWNKHTPDNYWQTYIDGKKVLPIGLEIASIGGEIRFYISTFSKKGKEALVPAMYSQYPGIELIEEPVDYFAEIPWKNSEWETWFTHLNKSSSQYRPIKTYIDFGLHTMPKEEEKVDPMTSLLEMMASIGPNERLYFQLVLFTKRQSSLLYGQLTWPWKEEPKWSDAVKEQINEIMQRNADGTPKKGDAATDFDGLPRITPGERQLVETLERHTEKYAYNVGLRWCYKAKKGHFRSAIINPINRVFSQYDVEGRAKLGVKWRTDFDYMWFSDPFGKRLPLIRMIEDKFYRMRIFVPHTQSDMPSTMTTEEIATLFHIPGKVALTPTLSRVPSTRGEAPSNLPVGEQ